MPTKAYLDSDGGGFVHLIDTPFVCPPGTTPELEEATGSGVCRGEPTGAFRPPPPDWSPDSTVIDVSQPPQEAFVAPGGGLPATIVWKPPPPPPPVQTAPATSTGVGSTIAAALRRWIPLLGIFIPEDNMADSDLGIRAPPGGFREPEPARPPRTDVGFSDPYGYVDVSGDVPEIGVTAPRYRPPPLPSSFVAPPAPFVPYAPGLPYLDPFVPYGTPEASPDVAPAPPGERVPTFPLDEPFQFWPDEDDPVWPRTPPRVPLPIVPLPHFPDIFVDPYPYTPSKPAPMPDTPLFPDPLAPFVPLPAPNPTPTFTPTPEIFPEISPLLPSPAPRPGAPVAPIGAPFFDPRSPGVGIFPEKIPENIPGNFLDPLPLPISQRADPCNCAKTKTKKKKKKKDPRTVCYYGYYTERKNKLIKRAKRKVPCQ